MFIMYIWYSFIGTIGKILDWLVFKTKIRQWNNTFDSIPKGASDDYINATMDAADLKSQFNLPRDVYQNIVAESDTYYLDKLDKIEKKLGKLEREDKIYIHDFYYTIKFLELLIINKI